MPSLIQKLFFPGITHGDKLTEWRLNAFFRFVSTYVLAISLPLMLGFIWFHFFNLLWLVAAYAAGMVAVYMSLHKKRLNTAVHIYILSTSMASAIFIYLAGFNDAAYWLFFNVIIAAIFINLRWAVLWSLALMAILVEIAVLSPEFTIFPSITNLANGTPEFNLDGRHMSSAIFLILISACFSVLLKSYLNDIIKKFQDDFLLLKSETAKKEKALEENRKTAETVHQLQKMEAVGQIASGVAHDFRNMLATISYAANMVKQKFIQLDPKLEKYVQMILSATTRSSELTRDLLAFSRKGRLQRNVLDIHESIKEVIQLTRHTIHHGIKITCHLNASPSLTKGDKSQLQNVFLNLIVNARDAMPDGGQIHIKTSNHTQRSADTHYPANMIGDYIGITVTDNGSGINDKTIKHIFEPFFTTKEAGKGTGMGLAGVYGTIKSHKGYINVSSKVNHGTSFQLYLPQVETNAIIQTASPPPFDSPSNPEDGNKEGKTDIINQEHPQEEF